MSFDPLAFHERAVRTPSHESVDAMRDLLVGTLDDHGVPSTVDDAGNVLASKGAGTDDRHVVLNTHVDTVPPHVPFSRDGDLVRGRGSCDAKGPLAALLDAFLTADPDYRLTLAVTPDEETASTGADHLTLDGDAYVVGEPTGLDVCTAARGRFEGSVTVRGEAGHAAHPESGVNAVAGAEGVLRALRTFDDEYGPATHDQLGGPTLTPTRIAGGEAVNQIPAGCRVDVDRRSVPPETAEGFESALNDHLRTAAPDADATFALTDRETPFLEAFATDADDPLVEAFRASGAGEIRPFEAATEASYFAPAPTVVFGPGVLSDEAGPVAHAEREYVSRGAIERAAAVLDDVLAAL